MNDSSDTEENESLSQITESDIIGNPEDNYVDGCFELCDTHGYFA
jgi:hypothetical protein